MSGADAPRMDNENFSPEDKAGNDAEGQPGYLGTPSGDVKKYPLDPNKSGNGKPETLCHGVK